MIATWISLNSHAIPCIQKNEQAKHAVFLMILAFQECKWLRYHRNIDDCARQGAEIQWFLNHPFLQDANYHCVFATWMHQCWEKHRFLMHRFCRCYNNQCNQSTSAAQFQELRSVFERSQFSLLLTLLHVSMNIATFSRFWGANCAQKKALKILTSKVFDKAIQQNNENHKSTPCKTIIRYANSLQK